MKRKTDLVIETFNPSPARRAPLAACPPVLKSDRICAGALFPDGSGGGGRNAFTLIELLITMGTIGLLISILLPSLGAAREQSKAVLCRSNIRQLHLANSYYADDFGGVYCAGAKDFMKNLHRWHGTRKKMNEVFDPANAPLTPYIGDDGAIRQCPTFPADEIAKSSQGFERGNGGYGYNNRFIGVQLNESRSGIYTVSTDRAGAYVHKIKKPGETVMFTDSGFAADGLIEYSFAEPRFQPQFPTYRAVPSIHFRHLDRANVAWCDGHVDSQKMTFTHASEFYRSNPEKFNIGWFGEADDNSLFDLK